MEDAVVIVDDANRVVDCNAAAQRLFGVGEDFYGTPLERVLHPLPEHVIDRLSRNGPASESGATDLRTELSFEIDDQRRHFSLTRSTVAGTSNTSLGQVVVFRDVTALKRREEDLELLRQILTRILRHNLRTDLNVIEGYAELLDADYDDDRIDEIIAASVSLNEIAEKAGHLERITQPGATSVHYDLTSVVADVVDRVRSRYPAVTVTIDAPDSRRVRVLAGLPVVVDNLVENAAEHNDAPGPTVHVTVEDGPNGPLLRVADNGPAIPDDELAVLEARQETSLSHGSGIGLWLVKWWADRSGAKLTFETGADGTVVSIEFSDSALVDS